MRQRSNNHLAFIRQLECLVCDDNVTVEAAHVRYADRSIKKPQTGIAIKPDDCYVVPLCGKHHREQHMDGERKWWAQWDIDPVKVAMRLYILSGDYTRAMEIVSKR